LNRLFKQRLRDTHTISSIFLTKKLVRYISTLLIKNKYFISIIRDKACQNEQDKY